MQPKGDASRVRDRLERVLNRAFPERQIHLRSGGRVAFLRISPRFQMVCMAVLAGLISWGAFTTVAFSLHDQVLAAKDTQVATAKLAYQSLLQEVASYQKRFSAVARDLEENHSLMLSLVEQNTVLQKNLRSAEGELRLTKAEQQEVVSTSESLKSKLHELHENIQNLTSNNFQLRDDLDETQTGLTVALQARNQALNENKRLATQAAELETRLRTLETHQQSAVSRLAEQTQTSIESLEKVVDLTGIKIADLIKPKKGKYPGQGGPFIEAKPDGLPAGHLKAALTTLEANLDRWETLQDAMRSMPFAAPLGTFQINSTFGKRHDPINNRWSMHYGLDLGAALKSPVYVTAPGTVAHVGRDSRYGNMIEVDHGFGIVTRYAHLHQILVKKGQKLEFHDKIGLLGNTGRSTGSHLHYEINFQGRPMNPMDFLQAGRHVFKE